MDAGVSQGHRTGILFAMVFAAASLAVAADGPVFHDPNNETWRLLDYLRETASAQRDRGHLLSAILTLEHACRIVIRENVADEGGHDYQIGQTIEELAEKGRRALLALIARQPARFPQGHHWARQALEDYRRRKRTTSR